MLPVVVVPASIKRNVLHARLAHPSNPCHRAFTCAMHVHQTHALFMYAMHIHPTPNAVHAHRAHPSNTGTTPSRTTCDDVSRSHPRLHLRRAMSIDRIKLLRLAPLLVHPALQSIANADHEFHTRPSRMRRTPCVLVLSPRTKGCLNAACVMHVF